MREYPPGSNLGLLKKVYQVTGHELPSKRVELENYLELFTGLGFLTSNYHIELVSRSIAVPVFHASRTVPVQQRVKVVEQLKRIKKSRCIIVRQEETNEWVNSLSLF